ncbi:MAG: heme o synthase [Paracoccaceae bacterium]|nr:heme o synthase [Paracoccaceae bacterium]
MITKEFRFDFQKNYFAKAPDFLALAKPRVMSLAVFTAIVGMITAPGSLPLATSVLAIIAIAVGAGAAGALNMWYDAETDSVMLRTSNRPLPSGRLSSNEALLFGLILAALSTLLLLVTTNMLAAGLLAFTIFFYVVVYTMWLKFLTPQNIVIGGAAGALPPIIGCTAVTAFVTVDSLILFAIIFLWTPPHFWALALFKMRDYEKAGVPMMPNVAGPHATRKQIFIYSLALAPMGVAPNILGSASIFYGIFAAILGAIFVFQAWRVLIERSKDHSLILEKRLFLYSIQYLFLIFGALLVDAGFGRVFEVVGL